MAQEHLPRLSSRKLEEMVVVIEVRCRYSRRDEIPDAEAVEALLGLVRGSLDLMDEIHSMRGRAEAKAFYSANYAQLYSWADEASQRIEGTFKGTSRI